MKNYFNFSEIYGSMTFRVSAAMTLTDIVRVIYGSDEQKYYDCITALNKRYDWAFVRPGATIKYLEKQVVDEL